LPRRFIAIIATTFYAASHNIITATLLPHITSLHIAADITPLPPLPLAAITS